MEKTTIITSWSGRTMSARKQHMCANCGDSIKIGTMYQRDVARMGDIKGVSPLRNFHLHLDCGTPWHHANTTHLLPQLGRLTAAQTHEPSTTLTVRSAGDDIGVITWEMPAGLSCKIMSTPLEARAASLTEISHTLSIIIKALTSASSNRKQALKISHAINELLLVAENT